MAIHMTDKRRQPKTIAQALIARITEAYQRESVKSEDIYYWPDSLPTPETLLPDPLVLFRPYPRQPGVAGDTLAVDPDQYKRKSVLPETLREIVAQRQKLAQTEPLMRMPLGLVDIPEVQQQDTLYVDLHGSSGPLTGGPLLIAGQQGSGKGTALQTLLLALVTRYTSRQLRCAVIDPNHDLDLFRALPHLQAEDGSSLCVDGENDDAIKQLITRCQNMVTQRREKGLQRWDEQSIKQLWGHNTAFPLILLIVNHYQSFVDRYEIATTLKPLILAFADARTMGMYLVLTSAEVTSRHVPADIMAKIGTRIGLFLNDSQRYDLLGRSPVLEPIAGRGLVLTRDRSLHEIQIALPVSGTTEEARNEQLKREITWLASQQ